MLAAMVIGCHNGYGPLICLWLPQCIQRATICILKVASFLPLWPETGCLCNELGLFLLSACSNVLKNGDLRAKVCKLWQSAAAFASTMYNGVQIVRQLLGMPWCQVITRNLCISASDRTCICHKSQCLVLCISIHQPACPLVFAACWCVVGGAL